MVIWLVFVVCYVCVWLFSDFCFGCLFVFVLGWFVTCLCGWFFIMRLGGLFACGRVWFWVGVVFMSVLFGWYTFLIVFVVITRVWLMVGCVV